MAAMVTNAKKGKFRSNIYEMPLCSVNEETIRKRVDPRNLPVTNRRQHGEEPFMNDDSYYSSSDDQDINGTMQANLTLSDMLNSTGSHSGRNHQVVDTQETSHTYHWANT